MPDGRFEWSYLDNPAGRAACWTAVDTADGSIVGSTALIKRRFRLGGDTLIGGIVADFSILPAHRGFGPALQLQRSAAEAVRSGEVDFAYGIPNLQALPVLLRAGFSTIGSVVELTCPLRTRATLRRRVPAFGVLAPAAARIVDGGLRAVHHARVARRLDEAHYHGRTFPTFDARFDRLWKRLSCDTELLLGERTSSFLRWRFERSPLTRHGIFGLVDTDLDELAGYLVYHGEEGRVAIDDVACLDTDHTLDNLLLRFLSAMRAAGTEAVTARFFGSPDLLAGYRRTGFLVRDAETTPVIALAPEASPMADLLDDPSSWWYQPADDDL